MKIESKEKGQEDVCRKRQPNGELDPSKQPNMNAMNVLPGTECSKARECDETSDSVDWDTGVIGPIVI